MRNETFLCLLFCRCFVCFVVVFFLVLFSFWALSLLLWTLLAYLSASGLRELYSYNECQGYIFFYDLNVLPPVRLSFFSSVHLTALCGNNSIFNH